MKEENLDTTVLIRMSKTLKNKLEALAIEKERDLSKQIRIILKEYLKNIEL